MAEDNKSQNLAVIMGGGAATIIMAFLRDQIPSAFQRILVAAAIGAVFGGIGAAIEHFMKKRNS